MRQSPGRARPAPTWARPPANCCGPADAAELDECELGLRQLGQRQLGSAIGVSQLEQCQLGQRFLGTIEATCNKAARHIGMKLLNLLECLEFLWAILGIVEAGTCMADSSFLHERRLE